MDKTHLVTFVELGNHTGFGRTRGPMPLTVEDRREAFKPHVGLPDVANSSKTQVLLGSGSLALAAMEAVCLFFVSASGVIVLLGGAAIGLAQGAAWIHSGQFLSGTSFCSALHFGPRRKQSTELA